MPTYSYRYDTTKNNHNGQNEQKRKVRAELIAAVKASQAKGMEWSRRRRWYARQGDAS